MENVINGLTLLGIPVVVLLPLLVMWLKQLGLPTSWTGVVCAIVGIVVAVLIQVVKTWPSTEPWVWVIVVGPMLGLAANGLNSQYQHFKETKKKDAGES